MRLSFNLSTPHIKSCHLHMDDMAPRTCCNNNNHIGSARMLVKPWWIRPEVYLIQHPLAKANKLERKAY